MKQFASIILFATVTATTAVARIGETADQIETRYGKPNPSSDTDELGHQRNQYLFGGYMIVVTFVSGQSEREKYSKEDESLLLNEEINALLATNATEGTTWKNKVQDKWTRSDDKLVAIYFFDGILDVLTNSYHDALKAAGKKREDDKADDKLDDKPDGE